MFTRVFDVQAQWAINFDLMPFFEVGSPGGWAQDKFLQLSNSASGDNVLALEIETDGTIAAVTGGDEHTERSNRQEDDGDISDLRLGDEPGTARDRARRVGNHPGLAE